ncbi:DUF397 domain-containing protein [Streptomyces sp. QH1-20]|uniref:DUF397 domain-containing protein n=1 Tax=Streptomyces sp. QH1-20 TaxID=3240934 RepID=UPI0035167E64
MSAQQIRPHWHRSSFSGGAEDNCVEVAYDDHEVWVRDSNAPNLPPLSFAHRPWQEFLARLESPTG